MAKPPKIIPWVATERTKYSDKYYAERFATDPAKIIRDWTIYVLWDCSTEFMVSQGMPTDADVLCWINWLQKRPDVDSDDIQSALGNCSDYLKPEPLKA